MRGGRIKGREGIRGGSNLPLEAPPRCWPGGRPEAGPVGGGGEVGVGGQCVRAMGGDGGGPGNAGGVVQS